MKKLIKRILNILGVLLTIIIIIVLLWDKLIRILLILPINHVLGLINPLLTSILLINNQTKNND
jgi:hypothetical protein